MIRGLPILADFWNGRAEPGNPGRWLDIPKIAIPTTLAGIASMTDLLIRLAEPLGGAALWAQALVPVALTVFCSLVIAATQTPESSVGFGMGVQNQTRSYRFSEVERWTAKAALPLVLAMALHLAWGLVPNGWTGRDRLSGFVCRADDGRPVRQGTVQALDGAGSTVSLYPASPDDGGFFVAELDRWGSRPQRLRVAAPGCAETRIEIGAVGGRAAGCPEGLRRRDLKEPKPVWILACR